MALFADDGMPTPCRDTRAVAGIHVLLTRSPFACDNLRSFLLPLLFGMKSDVSKTPCWEVHEPTATTRRPKCSIGFQPVSPRIYPGLAGMLEKRFFSNNAMPDRAWIQLESY
jgi:hypothetical protein